MSDQFVQTPQWIQLVDKALAGISLDEKDKKILFGMYCIILYKSTVEVLTFLYAEDPSFQESLLKVFDASILKLDEKKKEVFDKAMKDESENAFKKVFQTFAENLGGEEKTIIENNLKTLFSR